MGENENGVFMNLAITNEMIYEEIQNHGKLINKIIDSNKIIDDKVSLTNGTVASLKNRLDNDICPRLKAVEKASIVLFLSKNKTAVRWVFILGIILGVVVGLANLKDLLEVIK